MSSPTSSATTPVQVDKKSSGKNAEAPSTGKATVYYSPRVDGNPVYEPSKEDEGKPKRPLSAYNFFFKQERLKILRTTPTRPQGKPRRSHGKIGFADLARTIAARWKAATDDVKNIFNARANQDRERYHREMERWHLRKNGLLADDTSASLVDNKSEPKYEPFSISAAAANGEEINRVPQLSNNQGVVTPEGSRSNRRASHPAWTSGENASAPYVPDEAEIYEELEMMYQRRIMEFCLQERRRLRGLFQHQQGGNYQQQLLYQQEQLQQNQVPVIMDESSYSHTGRQEAYYEESPPPIVRLDSRPSMPRDGDAGCEWYSE